MENDIGISSLNKSELWYFCGRSATKKWKENIHKNSLHIQTEIGWVLSDQIEWLPSQY